MHYRRYLSSAERSFCGKCSSEVHSQLLGVFTCHLLFDAIIGRQMAQKNYRNIVSEVTFLILASLLLQCYSNFRNGSFVCLYKRHFFLKSLFFQQSLLFFEVKVLKPLKLNKKGIRCLK